MKEMHKKVPKADADSTCKRTQAFRKAKEQNASEHIFGGPMVVPKRELRVVVMDDSPIAVKGMLKILDAWPKLQVKVIYEDGRRGTQVPKNTDILLLDELMAFTTGSEIAEKLKKEKFKGVIASTSLGKKPEFTEEHFRGKKDLSKGSDEAMFEFVEFMNGLIMQMKK